MNQKFFRNHKWLTFEQVTADEVVETPAEEISTPVAEIPTVTADEVVGVAKKKKK